MRDGGNRFPVFREFYDPEANVVAMDHRGLDISFISPALTTNSPNEMPRGFYYDASTHDALALRYLIDLVGADRITIGMDDPIDMCEEHPLKMIGKAAGITDAEREQTCCPAMELMGESEGAE